MCRGPVERSLEKAAAAVLARIRRDAARAPTAALRRVLLHIADNLFSPKLNAERAFTAVGVAGNSMWLDFSEFTKMSPKVYINHYRVKVAHWLLRYTEHGAGDIGIGVGYSSPTIFGRVYKRLRGKKPSQVQREAARAVAGASLWELGEAGELDTHQLADDFVADAMALNSLVEAAVVRHARKLMPDGVIVADGAGDDRLKAEGIWSRIRDLPPAEARRLLRGCRFTSTALFDLLREKSRLEGRKDRQRGVEIAELALVSLEGSEESLGDRIHDQRALGYAWLGNAYRLAGDLWSAVTAFERCDEEWSHPMAPHEPAAAAVVYISKGTLGIFLRSYDDALPLIERSRECFHRLGDRQGEARALVQLATVHGYRGQFPESIAALEEAFDLVDSREDRHLAFTVCTNLANMLARAGNCRAATDRLELAIGHCQKLEYRIGPYEVEWVQADITRGAGDTETARKHYMAARAGFLDAEESRKVALTNLDLASLHSEAGQSEKAARFVAEALPVLGSMSLHKETLEALALLSRAVQEGELSAKLLRKVRASVWMDPLVEIAPIREDRDLPVLGEGRLSLAQRIDHSGTAAANCGAYLHAVLLLVSAHLCQLISLASTGKILGPRVSVDLAVGVDHQRGTCSDSGLDLHAFPPFRHGTPVPVDQPLFAVLHAAARAGMSLGVPVSVLRPTDAFGAR